MLEFPDITGRRRLAGDQHDIYLEMMRLIPRLDMMGEEDAATHLIEAVVALVDQRAGDKSYHILKQLDALEAYYRDLDDVAAKG